MTTGRNQQGPGRRGRSSAPRPSGRGAPAAARRGGGGGGGDAAKKQAPAPTRAPRDAAATTARAAIAGPVRTCVACRQPGARDDELMRLVEGPDGAIAVDARARLGGRGAWVHPTRACLATAAKRHAAERALKVAVRDDVSAEALITGVRAALERQLGSLLLAARRTRALVIGALSTGETLERQRVPLVLVATDAGDASRALSEELAAGAEGEGASGVKVRALGTKASLGALLGRGEVAILAVTAPRIAVQLLTVVDRLAGLEG